MVNFKRFQFWGRSPLTIVEFILGVASIVGGIYAASPVIQYSSRINGATPIVLALSHPLVLAGYGAILALSGLFIVIGILARRYQWRSVGLFTNILIRMYGVITTFIIQGILPFTWVAPVSILLITVVCYIVVRGFIALGEK